MKNIHKFKCKDDYFILDVNSGAIHVVDKIVYDIIDKNNIETRPNIINKFKGMYIEIKRLRRTIINGKTKKMEESLCITRSR